MNGPHSPRPIDHLVLPVLSLDDARARMTALGFMVAPDGVHPFGTSNANIYLRGGAFLEPLAVASRETCWSEARRGNSFVRNDQTYRFRVGGEGFSHTVFSTSDAEDDHHRYAELGYLDGPIVSFKRIAATPSGEQTEVQFSLAFAADPRSPDARFFSCETKAAPPRDEKLLSHPNGAQRILRVVLSEPNPTDFQYFLQDVSGQRDVAAHSFGMDIEVANGTIEVLTPEGLQMRYGLHADETARGMLHRAYVVGVEDLAVTRSWLEGNAVAFSERGGMLIVLPEIGQGCTVCFEALP